VELALRNTPPTDDDAEALRHVERCDRCRDELRMMTRVVTAARSAELEDMPAAPPEPVWLRITQGLSRQSAPQGPPPKPLSRSAKRKLLAVLAFAVLALAVVAGGVARHTLKRKRLMQSRPTAKAPSRHAYRHPGLPPAGQGRASGS
jgi:anti-sigma factor RsiW